MAQAKHVLLCWEYGNGNGHARQLKAIGERLAALGIRVTYALRRPDVGSGLGIPDAAIRAAPNWPLAPAATRAGKRMTNATHGDFLAQLMLGPEDDLAQRLALWHALIHSEKPDAIVADYAPSLSLLCHGRIPLVAIGNGYTLPLPTLPSFPRLIDKPLQFDEADAVQRFNDALRPYDVAPISRFPQINRADRIQLLTLPCLDPYRNHRQGGWLGSADTKDIVMTVRPKKRLFAYFEESRQSDIRLIEGLILSRLPGKAVFTLPLRRTVRLLETARISAPDGLAYLPIEFLNCGVAIHIGGSGLAMAAIAAGIPQVVVRSDLEKRMHAEALVERKAGIMLGWSSFTAQELAQAIRKAVNDAAMQKAARDLSLENTPYFRLDAAAEVADTTMSLLR